MTLERDDDACSDSSWLLASCDAQSDSSWLFAGGSEIQGRPQHCEDDLHSNTSWENVLERELSTVVQGEGRTIPEWLRVRSNPERFSDLDSSTPLIQLICAGHVEAALHLLRSSPEPLQLAAKVDSCGDTALTWTVYKANRSNIAWLELTCELLMISPRDAQKQNSMGFLPLHDAAWGNSPAAIATLLCAVFPHGVDVCARGQTPHQVGGYHHTNRRCMFPWPARDEMLQDALALSCESTWLETIAALRLSNLDQAVMQFMSVIDLQSILGVQRPTAELIACFLAPPRKQAPEWGVNLPSIPERSILRAPLGVRQRRRFLGLRRSACISPATCTNTLPELTCDEHHVSEDSGFYAGLRRARNSRCSFRDVMVIAVDMGDRHHVSFHVARTMPRILQKVKQQKWPSKARLQQERKRARADKESFR